MVSEEILNWYCERVAPALQQLISQDYCMVAVADLEKFIYFKAANKTDIGDITGQPLPHEDTMYQSIVQRKAVTGFVPEEVFGLRFRSTCYPIYDKQGEIIGGFGIWFSVKKCEPLLNGEIWRVFASAEEIKASFQEIVSTATMLSSSSDLLKDSFRSVLALVEKTDKVVTFANELCANTRLLGLKATIEAARVGEHGKGVEEVASEIRKMSRNSTLSLTEITDSISSIKKEINVIFRQVNQLSQSSKSQAEATEMISSAMVDLYQVVEKITKPSEITIK